MASILNASTTSTTGIVFTADASGVLQLQSNGTPALTVSGNTTTSAGSILNSAGRPILNQTGGILQVVSTQYTSQFTSTTLNQWLNITNFNATITPSSTSSKILMRVFVCGILFRPGANAVALRTTRNGTAVGVGSGGGNLGGQSATSPTTTADAMTTTGWEYLDSPASTSALTYQVQVYQDTSGAPFFINTNTTDQDNAYGRAQSSIVLMEIAV